jgi:VCBS repeat-containing protein
MLISSVEDQFNYDIIDEHGEVSVTQALVRVTVDGVNDPPELDGPAPEFLVPEGALSTPLTDFLNSVKDIDSLDIVSFFGSSLPVLTAGSLSLENGVLSFHQQPGEFDLEPDEESDPIDFFVRVTDSHGATASIPARVIVVGVNDPPEAVDDLFNSTTEDAVLTSNPFSLLSNDTDDGSAALTVSQVNGVAANVGMPIMIGDSIGRMGTLTVNDDGTFVFDPRPGFDSLPASSDSFVEFTYVASDGSLESTSAATVRIAVLGVNDPPVANNDEGATFTTDEDTELSNVNILANDSDVDGDDLFVFQIDGRTVPDANTLSFVATSSGGRTGTVVISPDGELSFNPSDEFDALAQDAVDAVMLDYTPTDRNTNTVDLPEATLTITITGVNDGPTIDEEGLAAAIQAAASLASLPDLSQPIEILNNVALNFDFSAVVSDPDTPTAELGYSRDGNIPAGLNEPSIDGDGQFSWTPNASSTPTEVSFTLNVIDATVPTDIISKGVPLTFRLVTPIR